MGYYIDQLAEQDRQRKLAELLAMEGEDFTVAQDQNSNGLMTQQDADAARAYAKRVMDVGGVDEHGRPTSTYISPQQNQQFLSALADPNNTIRTSGFDPSTFNSERANPNSYMPPPQSEQLPQNFIRNERTGRVMDMGQSQPAGPAMDYSMPIEIGGYGKGYRLKGDATRAVLADGRIVDMGRDTQEERKRRLADAEIAKREAEVRNLNERPKETGTWSTVESNGKQYLINNKTGAIKPAEVGGEQLMGKKSDAASKKESQMEGLGDAISQAKAILEGSAPDQKALPTGSGVGSMWDALAGQVGATPAGATEAQRMKVLGGALTSKMPRMEGPQSDKDTQLYKEMAGLVGDDTVPIPRRLDALDQVSKLWLKYEKAKPAATAYDAEKEARYQEWKKARGM